MTIDRPKIASKVQRSLYPIILLKFFSADKKAEAAQRKIIFPFFQQLTLPILRLTPPLGLSMILVVARQQVKVGGKPNLKEKLQGKVTKTSTCQFYQLK